MSGTSSSSAIDTILGALRGSGFDIQRKPLPGPAVIAQRRKFIWYIAAVVDVAFILQEFDVLSESVFVDFVKMSAEYGVEHSGGRLRGLQRGSAVIPVALAVRPDSSCKNVVIQPPRPVFAVLQYPVVIDLATMDILRRTKAPLLGVALEPFLRHLVDDHIVQPFKDV